MINSKYATQVQLINNHLENIGAINSDDARRLYSIVDVPTVISKLGKVKRIRHKPINRPNPVTGKIRGIVEYSLERSNAE